MKQQLLAHECCPDLQPIPNDIHWLSGDICKGLNKLRRRYLKKFKAPKQRLVSLSQPVRRNVKLGKFFQKCPCQIKRTIRMIYLQDCPYPPRTRTEQLALPYSWRIALTKEQVTGLFEPGRIDVLNRTLRKSYLSVYSRLANSRLPPNLPLPTGVPIPKKRFTAMSHDDALDYLDALAAPKKYKKIPEPPHETKPLSSMVRYKKLAKPKLRYEFEKKDWVFTLAMKRFKSERLNKLAVPKSFPNAIEALELPIRPTPEALHYKISPRVKELSEPKLLRKAESDLKENPFSVVPNALKYRATARIKELAEPKEAEDKHIRENPNFISPAALKYKASARINSLAAPRER